MTERHTDLDAVFAELVATTPAVRDEASERARRRRMSALIDAHIATRDAPPARPSLRATLLRRAVPLSAAAGVLVLLAAVRSSRHAPAELPEPERLPAHRSAPPSPGVAPSPAERAPEEARAPRSPARGGERAAVARPAPASSSSSQGSSEAVPPPSASTGGEPAPLAAQNELFQAAVRSQRRGDDEGALAQFDALLARYPGSPLAADARVRKFRTLARLGRDADARAAAAEYLARHPAGFARPEAEQLLRNDLDAAKGPAAP